ncbi:unnamed protein product [Cuscuta europaea]|uniref:B box-type domain-containing protein n=1 Tax=Cuscuta europaea TaxID=41803 RepID=A0A9P0ZAV9_CUSEU|nr:unnamed protein product [Cuscuta europaea]
MASEDSQQLLVSLPGWLAALLKEKFFSPCFAHQEERKNEKNIFCLDCCEAICAHCLFPLHHSHRFLQIRRYIYHDVLRLRDAQKLLDSAFVQSYISNGEKVMFLKERPITRPCRSSAKPCITCQRAVQNPFGFCSISCKLQHMVKTGVKLSDYIRNNWDSLVLPETAAGDDAQMTPETVLEPAASSSAESASCVSVGGGGLMDCRRILASLAATAEIVRKKRSSLSSSCRCSPRPATVAVNMRKNQRKTGMPYRSPLH